GNATSIADGDLNMRPGKKARTGKEGFPLRVTSPDCLEPHAQILNGHAPVELDEVPVSIMTAVGQILRNRRAISGRLLSSALVSQSEAIMVLNIQQIETPAEPNRRFKDRRFGPESGLSPFAGAERTVLPEVDPHAQPIIPPRGRRERL